jgi:hypothetical protein
VPRRGFGINAAADNDTNGGSSGADSGEAAAAATSFQQQVRAERSSQRLDAVVSLEKTIGELGSMYTRLVDVVASQEDVVSGASLHSFFVSPLSSLSQPANYLIITDFSCHTRWCASTWTWMMRWRRRRADTRSC